MNIKEAHSESKPVSAVPLFKGTENTATALQILATSQLKEHITKVPAMLVCINGEVVFQNEKQENKTLKNGDYIMIEPFVKHWVDAVSDTQLLLIK